MPDFQIFPELGGEQQLMQTKEIWVENFNFDGAQDGAIINGCNGLYSSNSYGPT